MVGQWVVVMMDTTFGRTMAVVMMDTTFGRTMAVVMMDTTFGRAMGCSNDEHNFW